MNDSCHWLLSWLLVYFQVLLVCTAVYGEQGGSRITREASLGGVGGSPSRPWETFGANLKAHQAPRNTDIDATQKVLQQLDAVLALPDLFHKPELLGLIHNWELDNPAAVALFKRAKEGSGDKDTLQWISELSTGVVALQEGQNNVSEAAGRLPSKGTDALSYASLRRVVVAALVRNWLKRPGKVEWSREVVAAALNLLHQVSSSWPNLGTMRYPTSIPAAVSAPL
jgi:hypothetical protein